MTGTFHARPTQSKLQRVTTQSVKNEKMITPKERKRCASKTGWDAFLAALITAPVAMEETNNPPVSTINRQTDGVMNEVEYIRYNTIPM